MKAVVFLAMLLGGCATAPPWQKERQAALDVSGSCSNPVNDAAGAHYQLMTFCSGGRERFVYRMPRCVTRPVYCN